MDIASFFESPDRLAGEDGGAGGATSGGIAEGMGEAESFVSDTVEGGGFDHGIPICSGVSVALIVGNAEEDVGPVDSREL